MKIQSLVVSALLGALAVGGCSKKEEPAPPPAPKAAETAKQPQMPPSHPPTSGGQEGQAAAPKDGQTPPSMPPSTPVKRDVVVPDDVKNAWKAVVLQVTDKAANSSQDVTVDIGQTAKVGDLDVTVDSFLPAFSMTGNSFTSTSTEPTNPAAKLTVKENGKEIFSSFVFSMHPDVHPFQHEKYSIALKNFVKK